MIRLSFAILLLGAALLPGTARADALQQESFSSWKAMQECAKQANLKFPDHTPEGNARREAARQECLRAHRLPVSGPAVPPPTR